MEEVEEQVTYPFDKIYLYEIENSLLLESRQHQESLG